MGKFLLANKFELDFVPQWEGKGAYLMLEGVTIGDMETRLPKLSQAKEGDPESVQKATHEMVTLLKDKFAGGKAPNNEGELVEVLKEDIQDLPIMVITEAVNFLLEGVNKSKATQ